MHFGVHFKLKKIIFKKCSMHFGVHFKLKISIMLKKISMHFSTKNTKKI